MSKNFDLKNKHIHLQYWIFKDNLVFYFNGYGEVFF